MSYRLLPILLGCTAGLAAAVAFADVTDVRPMPRQVNLVASGGNVVSVTWRISTSPDHTFGVASATANIIDPASGAILQRAGEPLTATGAGPYVLRDLISLDDATVRSWTDQGLRRVVLERLFVDPAGGRATTATVTLSLSRSRLQATRDAAPADLSIVSLRVEFDSGNNTVITTEGEPLRASLAVQYTGTGILHGRWQIAEPGSSEGAPSFRTMALVNANLQTNQHTTLRSPLLPTLRSGKYLLRFCATSLDTVDVPGDAQCPDVDLTVVAIYHVEGQVDAGIGIIRGISPNRQAVSEGSSFSWQPMAGAIVYQLQIFELAPQAEHSTSREGSAGVEPRFVGGMLLNATTSNTPLSDLARSKLLSGQRYLWRVTAHDKAGRMIGSSAEASFVYRPGG